MANISIAYAAVVDSLETLQASIERVANEIAAIAQREQPEDTAHEAVSLGPELRDVLTAKQQKDLRKRLAREYR